MVIKSMAVQKMENKKMRIFMAFGLLALLTVTGCAPMTPAPTTSSEPLPPVSQPAPKPVEPPPPAEPRRIPGAIQPDATQQPAPSAVSSLLAQGWRQHSGSNYEAALGIAERAQRIEPRNPEVYLLMASAQLALYRNEVAEQLVRRGLSLSQSGTTVNRQLQALLGQITSGR